ncbi:MAG: ATPase domain-containing protein [Candidatus Bathyarchaeota archaeon]
MDKAKELEKKYEWLQAAEYYKKASELESKEKNFLKAAEIQERIGFCFRNAAFQAQTNIEFRKRLKQSIQAYEQEASILKSIEEKNLQLRIDHADALVAHAKSWLEATHSKKRKLLDKWWTIENQLLSEYEKAGDLHSVGKTCNDLMELSRAHLYWLASDYSEQKKMFNKQIHLAEKAIKTFSELDDEYELARAYCCASFWYGFSGAFVMNEDEQLKLIQKKQEYENKASELSKKTGDDWLIGFSYHSIVGNSWVELDPFRAIEMGENAIKYGNITRNNVTLGFGKCLTSSAAVVSSWILDDPSKRQKALKKAAKLAREATHIFQIMDLVLGLCLSYLWYSTALNFLTESETNPEIKQKLLKNSKKMIEDGMEKLHDWTIDHYGGFYFNLSWNLGMLSNTKTDITEKRELLKQALTYAQKYLTHSEKTNPIPFNLQTALSGLSVAQRQLANIETDNTKKIELLNKAAISEEKAIKVMETRKKIHTRSDFGRTFYFGMRYYNLGGILRQIYSLTKDEKTICRAIKAYKSAIEFIKDADLPTRMAETYWQVAQLTDVSGEHQKSSENYELAAAEYDLASKNIPQLKQFYNEHSAYMRAWSQIEQARYAHSIEDYDKAKEHYKKAAELHESSESWSYMTANFFAWANVEEAEGLSRSESTQQAKQTFQKANEQFGKAKTDINKKLEEITSPEEKEMATRLLKATDLRRKFCQARILLEEAKLLDRKGKYLNSSKSYAEASEKLDQIIEELESEAERKELKLIAVLCRAWERMALAEETSSPELYLEAAKLFGRAKDFSVTKKTSLWALGNSSFCKGLAAGINYQDSLDLAEHTSAKGHMKNAASSYLQAGFKNASEYAKATQRLFDAHVFMNQAEGEVDQERKIKQYQMAEKLLQISAGSFLKAKQPEKTAQVQLILKTVREEKKLAVSLNEVLHAPAVASTTMSFATPAQTSEVSVGLEQFEHANVQANLIARTREVKVGESFCLTLEFVNAGKEPALLTRVEDFVPSDFIVVKKPEIYRLEETCLNMKGKQLVPLKLVEAKLVLQPSKKGTYLLKPRVHYLNELGQDKSLELKSVEIKVEEIILEGRVSTGTKELDSLLLGGIPNEYAVVLAGPPCDEREMMMKNFLKAGADEGAITFYISKEAVDLEDLLAKPNFILFLCNPKPKSPVPDLPNVYKLRGTNDLTNLGIALAKACRGIGKSVAKRRVCVEILSDVLVEYGTKTARNWTSELITDLGSKGFTLLAVMDPKEHPTDQATTVLNLFDGEIEITQTEDPLECRKSIRVKKLRNQDYIKNPICLTGN